MSHRNNFKAHRFALFWVANVLNLLYQLLEREGVSSGAGNLVILHTFPSSSTPKVRLGLIEPTLPWSHPLYGQSIVFWQAEEYRLTARGTRNSRPNDGSEGLGFSRKPPPVISMQPETPFGVHLASSPNADISTLSHFGANGTSPHRLKPRCATLNAQPTF